MRCDTCKHWQRPEERDDFSHVMSVYPLDGNYPRLREASDAADRLFGRCQAIDLVTEVAEGEPIPLAITKDGSDYTASLFTQAEFGCALWETKA